MSTKMDEVLVDFDNAHMAIPGCGMKRIGDMNAEELKMALKQTYSMYVSMRDSHSRTLDTWRNFAEARACIRTKD